jgi:CHRD domain
MIKSRRGAVIASLIGALLVFGTPGVAFADKADPRADQTVDKKKDKDDEKDAKKDDKKHDRKRHDAGKKDDRREGDKKHEEARKGDGRHEGDENSHRHDGRHDDSWKDRRHDDGWRDDRHHDDDHDRDWDHGRDRDHDHHYWDTHRRYYRYGYYGSGYYDDCGYYGYRYGGSGDDYNYYGPDACSYEYGGYGSHLLARMSGDQVVGHPGVRDAYGTANLDVQPSAGRVCFRLAYDGIPDATGAQVHYGRVGENGPVAVLLHVGDNGDDGCVPGDPRVLDDIRSHPWAFYVNVDAPGYDGAMRGQLEAPDYRYH